MTYPTAYSQVTWPGAGDVDDCWVIAPYWALVASRSCTRVQLPTITVFRAAAGVPDVQGKSNGGNNGQALVAIKAIFPKSGAYSYVGLPAGFYDRLKLGQVASVSVNSALLPSSVQFGFLGNHQIAVALDTDGVPLVMNPLQREGAPLLRVSVANLNRAAVGLYGDGKFHAVMIPDHPPVVPPAPVDPTIALRAEITRLLALVAATQSTVGARDATIAGQKATIDGLMAKIAKARADLA